MNKKFEVNVFGETPPEVLRRVALQVAIAIKGYTGYVELLDGEHVVVIDEEVIWSTGSLIRHPPFDGSVCLTVRGPLSWVASAGLAAICNSSLKALNSTEAYLPSTPQDLSLLHDVFSDAQVFVKFTSYPSEEPEGTHITPVIVEAV